MRDIEQRVDRGARLLDSEVPGWYTQINTDALVIHNSCRCIIGQLFDGYFTRGRVALGIAANEADDYGFDAPPTFYQPLRELWIQEIELRKLAASSPIEQRELIGVGA